MISTKLLSISLYAFIFASLKQYSMFVNV